MIELTVLFIYLFFVLFGFIILRRNRCCILLLLMLPIFACSQRNETKNIRISSLDNSSGAVDYIKCYKDGANDDFCSCWLWINGQWVHVVFFLVILNVWIDTYGRENCANWEILWFLLLPVFKITKQKSLIILIWCALTYNSPKWTIRLSLRVYSPLFIVFKQKCICYRHIFKFDGIGIIAKIYHFCNRVTCFVWWKSSFIWCILSPSPSSSGGW